jgi:hypothetical protein
MLKKTNIIKFFAKRRYGLCYAMIHVRFNDVYTYRVDGMVSGSALGGFRVSFMP